MLLQETFALKAKPFLIFWDNMQGMNEMNQESNVLDTNHKSLHLDFSSFVSDKLCILFYSYQVEEKSHV